MDLDVTTLPEDPQQLKSLLLQLQTEHTTEYQTLEKQYKESLKKYNILQEKFLTLQRKFFGRSSEKLSKEDQDQLRLFNEAEAGVDDVDNSDEPPIDSEKIVIKEYFRKKRGRRPLPDNLPREEKVYDVSEKEKHCVCCGKERPCIGKDTTEELDIVPAQIKVIKHITLKYGPCDCDEFMQKELPEVITAQKPARMIPHSIVSSGLLAYVITSKYADSLPLHRQSKMFKRINVDICKSTLCNWVLLAAERCKPLINYMKEEIRGGPLIQMDETTLQVLHEEGRDPTSKSYMWVMVGYPQMDKPLIVYDYYNTRSQSVPLELLKDYKGFLQTDGYAGYNNIGGQSGITHVGCFAHARTYFYDALQLSKKSKTANKGLSYIQKLYKIEHELRAKDWYPDKFVAERKKMAEPVLAEFHSWLQEKSIYITPESKAGKAVNYTIKEWNKLVRYLESEFLTPDNNKVENAIRPFVVGRKNWLFSNNPRGARASAVLYSLVESAKANELEPYHYLRYIFTRLPVCSTREDRKKLLPNRLSKNDLIIS